MTMKMRLVSTSSASPTPQTPSTRILKDIKCVTCGDFSSGRHYGVYTCDGCAGFFKRTIRAGDRKFECKSKNPGTCVIDRTHRNQCRKCRIDKCIAAGMNKNSVQSERGPRTNSRQHRVMEHISQTSSSSGAPSVAASPPATSPSMPQLANTAFFGQQMSGSGSPPMMGSMPLLLYQSFGRPMTRPSQLEVALTIISENVNWAMRQPEFSTIAAIDQLKVLRGSWANMFIFNCVEVPEKTQLLALLPPSHATSLDDFLIQKSAFVAFGIMQNFFKEYAVTEREIAYFKALTLFNTADQELNATIKAARDQLCSRLVGLNLLKDERHFAMLTRLDQLCSDWSNKVEDMFFHQFKQTGVEIFVDLYYRMAVGSTLNRLLPPHFLSLMSGAS